MGSAEGGESECEGAVPPSAGRVWSEELPGMHPGLQACHRDRLSEQGRENLAQGGSAGPEGGRQEVQRPLRQHVQGLGQGTYPRAWQVQAPVGSDDDGDDPMLPAFSEEAGHEDVPKPTEGDGDEPMLPALDQEDGKEDVPQSTEGEQI